MKRLPHIPPGYYITIAEGNGWPTHAIGPFDYEWDAVKYIENDQWRESWGAIMTHTELRGLPIYPPDEDEYQEIEEELPGMVTPGITKGNTLFTITKKNPSEIYLQSVPDEKLGKVEKLLKATLEKTANAIETEEEAFSEFEDC